MSINKMCPPLFAILDPPLFTATKAQPGYSCWSAASLLASFSSRCPLSVFFALLFILFGLLTSNPHLLLENSMPFITILYQDMPVLCQAT